MKTTLPQPGIWARTASLLALIALGWGLWQWLTWPDVKALATENPATTAFIERYQDRAAATATLSPLDWRWVPYPRISRNLKRAVLVAEDVRFFSHHGFATEEIKAAIEDAVETRTAPRGASTITQQLAKNLWLSPSRNPLRKLKEAVLTIQLEKHLDKHRILEIYLNVVELGEGIYGGEAAAQRYFDKPASRLSQDEAALLAASLPRPTTWHPGVEDTAYLSRFDRIVVFMWQARFLDRYF